LAINQAKKTCIKKYNLFKKNVISNAKKETLSSIVKLKTTSKSFSQKSLSSIICLDQKGKPLTLLPPSQQLFLNGLFEQLMHLTKRKKYAKNQTLKNLINLKILHDGNLISNEEYLSKLNSIKVMDDVLNLYKTLLILPFEELNPGFLKYIKEYLVKLPNIGIFHASAPKRIGIFTLLLSAISKTKKTLEKNSHIGAFGNELKTFSIFLINKNLDFLKNGEFNNIPIPFQILSFEKTQQLEGEIKSKKNEYLIKSDRTKMEYNWTQLRKDKEFFFWTIKPILSIIKKMGSNKTMVFPTLKPNGEMVMIQNLTLKDSNEIVLCIKLNPTKLVSENLKFLEKDLEKAGFPFRISLNWINPLLNSPSHPTRQGDDTFLRVASIPSPIFAGYNLLVTPENPERLFKDKRKNLLIKSILLICLSLIAAAGGILLLKSVKRERDFISLKANFVARISHELKTPLSLIQLYSETLASGKVEEKEKRKHFSEIIIKESIRLNRLITNVLDFSKKRSTEPNSGSIIFDPNIPLLEIYKLFYPQLKKEGFCCSFKCEKGGQINTSLEGFKQAVMNLISNSRKFSKEKKEIDIDARYSNKTFRLSIKDKGLGIPPEETKKVFQAFYRGKFAGETRGVGLGLSIIKDFVDSSNGRIEINQRKGGGTEIVLILPRFDLVS
jgi:signal transduction histidine kinase